MNIPSESRELLSDLRERLPELEWKISQLGSFFSCQQLPRGLFRLDTDSTSAACIAEIKADIDALSKQQNKGSALYLADRIRRKVHVLVTLCQMHQGKNKPREKVYFGIKTLSTRQQWINDLELEIKTLSQQQQAMIKALKHLKDSPDANAILHLKAELGEVERRLTLAQETFNRAVS
ncbi:coiled-coil protein [Legionella wadsworthii]|uniref:Coiled-coil protein n=1 Tax=Legionella wadsworthii TaxID=28088 RepID=A0A378LWT3_9GAMM|nr:hypothetical protein [Legionella wadsworthii]STY30721.1 coiled-coil protein [Legionella wadsworthii]